MSPNDCRAPGPGYGDDAGDASSGRQRISPSVSLEQRPQTVCIDATADEILATVQLVQISIKKLVENNAQ
ncbi:MAG: hypothetical protein ACRDQU_01490 [Pseudonocardiaceae bacterium]